MNQNPDNDALIDAETIGQDHTGVGTPREMTSRGLQGVPKHTGALTGFVVVLLGALAIGGFSSLYTADRIQEVNGPVGSGMLMVVSLIIVGFAWFQARVVSDINPQKVSFYKGMINAGGISLAVSSIALVGTLVYRDLSGGLVINGEEIMMIVGLLLCGFIFTEMVTIRNLGGRLLRKHEG